MSVCTSQERCAVDLLANAPLLYQLLPLLYLQCEDPRYVCYQNFSYYYDYEY